MSGYRRRRPLAFVLSIALAAGVAGPPADAVEAPPGSKNFTPPTSVPNYFSNESGPFQGGTDARGAQSETAPIVAAPRSRGRVAAVSRRGAGHHVGRVAKGRGHTKLAHGKQSAHRQYAHAAAARGGRVAGARTASGGVRPSAGKAVAAKTRAASSKSKRLAAVHG